jgi:MoaA/NifB/PqqE/SkfB family radical SAM enzyme
MDKLQLDGITIEITNHCQLKCAICGIGGEVSRQQIAADDFVLMMDRLQERFDLQWVSVTGGEPFLHPQLREILRYLARLKLQRRLESFGLYTNGVATQKIQTLLAQDRKFLSGMRIGVSLDGLQRAHDRRRGRGSYCKTMATLNWLSRECAGVYDLEVKFTVGTDNVGEMLHVYRLANALGARFSPKLLESGVGAYYHRHEDGSGPLVLPWGDEECLTQIRSVMREDIESRRKAVDLKALKVLLCLVRDGERIIRRCRTPERCLFVTSCGKVYPCLYMAPAGTIYSSDFPGEDFFKERQKQIATGKNGKCSRCFAYHGFMKDFNFDPDLGNLL